MPKAKRTFPPAMARPYIGQMSYSAARFPMAIPRLQSRWKTGVLLSVALHAGVAAALIDWEIQRVAPPPVLEMATIELVRQDTPTVSRAQSHTPDVPPIPQPPIPPPPVVAAAPVSQPAPPPEPPAPPIPPTPPSPRDVTAPVLMPILDIPPTLAPVHARVTPTVPMPRPVHATSPQPTSYPAPTAENPAPQRTEHAAAKPVVLPEPPPSALDAPTAYQRDMQRATDLSEPAPALPPPPTQDVDPLPQPPDPTPMPDSPVGTGLVSGAHVVDAQSPDTAVNLPPSYPAEAIALRQQGQVVLSVDIDPTGLPTRVLVANSTGSVALDTAAAEAVSHWHFHPAMSAGQPVSSSMPIVIRFVLSQAGAHTSIQ